MKSKKGWDSGFQLQCVISAKSCWVSNEIAAGSQVSEKLRSLQKGHAMCVMRVEVKKEVLTNASEISAHNRASVYLCARSHLLRLVIESVVLVCWHWDLVRDFEIGSGNPDNTSIQLFEVSHGQTTKYLHLVIPPVHLCSVLGLNPLSLYLDIA